jgi:Fic family protein
VITIIFHQTRLDLKNIKDFLLYIINGVYETSTFTIDFIEHFNTKIKEAQELLQKQSPQIYTHEIVNYLFYDFYTKNEYLRENIKISRNTASKYLKELVRVGLLVEEKVGKEKLYKNTYL